MKMAMQGELDQLKSTLQAKFQAKIEQQGSAVSGNGPKQRNEKLVKMIDAIMSNFAMGLESKSDLPVPSKIPKFHRNKDENSEEWLMIFQCSTERKTKRLVHLMTVIHGKAPSWLLILGEDIQKQLPQFRQIFKKKFGAGNHYEVLKQPSLVAWVWKCTLPILHLC